MDWAKIKKYKDQLSIDPLCQDRNDKCLGRFQIRSNA